MPPRLRRLFLSSAIFIFTLVSSGSLLAQRDDNGAGAVGTPQTGSVGVTRTTDDIMRQEGIRAASGIARPPRMKPEKKIDRKGLNQNAESQQTSRYPVGTLIEKRAANQAAPFSPQTLGLNFLGVTASAANAFPPDVMGDVGPTQYIIAVNGRIQSYSKTSGNPDVALNADMDVFFSSVMSTNVATFTSDPRIRYDRLTGRWFVIIIDVPGGSGAIANKVLLAVSDGSIITNSTVWTFFSFNAPSTLFADYPTLGIDKHALYIGANMFSTTTGNFSNTYAWVVRKSSLLTAGPIVVTTFSNLIATLSPFAGPYTPQGVDNFFDTTATEGYFIGVDNAVFGRLVIRRISNPGTTPSISGNINITVPTTSAPIKVPHLGNTGGAAGQLDAIDDRLYMAVVRNGKIYTAHHIGLNSSGVATGSPTRNGPRWYEIGNITGTPTLLQSGTVFDNAASNPRFYWFPSLNVSGQGHIAMGFSSAGENDRVNAATVGRLASDALGTMQTPLLYTSTAFAYNPTSGGDPIDRWGDYSFTSVDPNDDMTMWTIQEFCNATNSWAVQVVKLIAPPPAIPSTVSPSSVSINNSNVNVVVTGTSSSGSGFFDPGAAFPHRISAAVNGGGVTINSITYTDPTHITLNVTIDGGATIGGRTITVTNPDGQSATSASGILTITNTCPSITLSPTALSNGAAGSSYSQAITASGGATPYSYNVTSGSLPAGVTLSSAGLLSGTPTYGGVYNFTVTAMDDSSCSGNQAYTWTVTGCPDVNLSPASLPNGTVALSYAQTIIANGGTAPYTYVVSAGSLPGGLSLSNSGALTGTPTAPGVFNFTVKATDANNCSDSVAYAITINSDPTTILLGALGNAYTQDFNTLAYNVTTSSIVPNGWAFVESGTNANSTYAVDSGFGVQGNTYSFGNGSSTDRALGGIQSGSLNPTIGAKFLNSTGSSITSLNVAYVGEQWRLGMAGRGPDTMKFQYSLNATSLSTGTWTSVSSLNYLTTDLTGSANPRNGNDPTKRTAVSATISSLNISHGSTFWIRWQDANPTGADDGLAIDDFSLIPNGDVTPANPSISASGALPSTVYAGNATLLTASVRPGTNPTSTNISVKVDLSTIGGGATQTMFDNGTNGDQASDDSTYSYLATVSLATSPGSKILPVNVSDGESRTASVNINLTVPACPTITLAPPSLQNGNQNVAYNQTITASGGTSPYTFSVTAGSLPAGLTLSSSGDLSGTPTGTGTSNFTITAEDSNHCTGSRAYSLTIQAASCPTITINSGALPNGTSGAAYSYSYTATGGVSPYFFALTNGNVPQGLSLAANGLISGTATMPGTSVFTVTATDSNGCPGTRVDSITIDCPTITLSPPLLPDGEVSAIYNQTVTASGGTAPYTFALTSGTLPTGLSINANGQISGFPSMSETLSYTITATDSFGCEGSRSYSIAIQPPTTVSLDVTVVPKWNMLSVPLDVADSSVGAIFPGATSPAFSFVTSGGYMPATVLLPGVGYWLKFATGNVFHLEGQQISDDTIDVGTGWNMVGSLTNVLPTSSVMPLGTTITSPFFSYNTGYVQSDTIYPGKAYWVKVSNDGQLHLTTESAVIPLSRSAGMIPQRFEKNPTLTFISQQGIRQSLFVVGDGTKEARDIARFELPPVPPNDVFDARFASGRFAEVFSGKGTVAYDVALQGPDEVILLAWDVAEFADYDVHLRDVHSGADHLLTGSGSMQIPALANAALKLLFEPSAPVPTSATLQQNYPNPFNPTTTIRYGLSEDGHVNVSVYSVLGEKVVTLVDEKQEAGWHSVVWDAGGVQSGVYFYSLQSGGKYLARKLLLMR